jgi:CheY-like chemotaxis protein
MVRGRRPVNHRQIFVRGGTVAVAVEFRGFVGLSMDSRGGGGGQAVEAAGSAAGTMKRDPGAPVRLLLVEDEALIALMLEDMVEGLGCAVTGLAPRVALGVAMAETGHFDAAILDVNVAGENVEPVAERLAAKGVPFIFATGYGEAGVPLRYRDRPVVAKPFRPDQLEAAINKAVGIRPV